MFQSSTASPEVRIRKLQQFEKLEALADSKIEGKVFLLDGCTPFLPLEDVTAGNRQSTVPFSYLARIYLFPTPLFPISVGPIPLFPVPVGPIPLCPIKLIKV